MIATIDHHQVNLKYEWSWFRGKSVRVTTKSGINLPMHRQTIKEVLETTAKSYERVQAHLSQIAAGKIAAEDIDLLSLHLVLKHFYIYNVRRLLNKEKGKKDLSFILTDLQEYEARSQMLNFFRHLYPKDYPAKCKIITGQSDEEFRIFEEFKEGFENM